MASVRPTTRLPGKKCAAGCIKGAAVRAGSGFRHPAVLEQACGSKTARCGTLRPLAVVSDFSTIKALVMEGLGISFVYAPVAERELQNRTLARFDLDTGPLWGPFSFVCLKHNCSPLLLQNGWRNNG